MSIDLFGTVPPGNAPVTGKGSKGGRQPGRFAYPAMPGTGPVGKTCRDCANYAHGGTGRRAFPKCGLMRASWTSSYGTDIKARSPACSKFEEPTP